MDKRFKKKTGEELTEYLQFQRRGYWINNKKGKGSYCRKEKHKGKIKEII